MTTPGMPGQPGLTGLPGTPMPGMPGQTGYPGQSPYSTQPGANGLGATFQQPGMTATGTPAGVPTDAQKMIQTLLTSPRQGGMPGQPAGSVGQTIGGGIAGVASTADDEGIKIYKDHTNYKEWEFIYDYTKDGGPNSSLANGNLPQNTNQNGPSGLNNNNSPGNSPGGGPTGPPPTSTGPFGQTPFGQPPFGQPQMPPTTTPRQ